MCINIYFFAFNIKPPSFLFWWKSTDYVYLTIRIYKVITNVVQKLCLQNCLKLCKCEKLTWHMLHFQNTCYKWQQLRSNAEMENVWGNIYCEMSCVVAHSVLASTEDIFSHAKVPNGVMADTTTISAKALFPSLLPKTDE